MTLFNALIQKTTMKLPLPHGYNPRVIKKDKQGRQINTFVCIAYK